MAAHRLESFSLEEPLSYVVLSEHWDMRPEEKLARLRSEPERALEDRELAIDLRVCRTGLVCTIRPHSHRLPLCHVSPHVSRGNCRHLPAAEERHQVELDLAFHV
jgi:hypothetical protein